MSGTTLIRIVIGAIGALLLLGAVVVFTLGGPEAFIGALWMLVAGSVLLIAAAIEVTRYRSEQAERSRLDPGPGGGEATALEPRFRRTDETFVDPTSHLRMRVFIDPRTGERRYLAED